MAGIHPLDGCGDLVVDVHRILLRISRTLSSSAATRAASSSVIGSGRAVATWYAHRITGRQCERGVTVCVHCRSIWHMAPCQCGQRSEQTGTPSSMSGRGVMRAPR